MNANALVHVARVISFSRDLALFCVLFFGCLLLSASPVEASPAAPKLSWTWLNGDVHFWLHGQYRPRFELMQQRDLRNPNAQNAAPADLLFVNHRARFGLGLRLWKQVEFFIQMQDVRRWGSETDTLGDFQADGFDVHQAWIGWRPVEPLLLQVGRMELIYDDHRLIGNVGWLQQARAFDAIRVKWESKQLQAHIALAKLTDVGEAGRDRLVALAWLRLQYWAFWQPSFYYILHHHPQDNEELRHTAGFLMRGKAAGFRYVGEFYLQFGRQENAGQARDILAYMASLDLAYAFRAKVKPTIHAWATFVSGQSNDPNDTTIRTFDTLFATNHKFYGLVDMFLNLPLHTKGRGLMDFGLGFQIHPIQRLMMRLDFHYFRLMTPLSAPGNTERQELGPELDIVAKYWIMPGVFSVSGGYGFVVPIAEQAFALMGKGNDIEHWMFLEVDFKF